MKIKYIFKNLGKFNSLNTRYLIVATLISVLLITGTFVANRYFSNISSENSYALKLRAELTDKTQKIRHALWLIESNLHRLITAYDKNLENIVNKNLHQAIDHINSLIIDDSNIVNKMHDHIKDVKTNLNSLKNEVSTLLALRKDVNWVYPALPYVTGTLLDNNINFQNAVRTALRNLSDIHEQPYTLPEYRNLSHILDLWQKIILQFRALMIRFSGLQDIPANIETAQEKNIDMLLKVLNAKISELQTLKNTGSLTIETELSVDLMVESSRTWSEEFTKAKKIRQATYWRADTEFLDTRIHPAIKNVHAVLQSMENAIANWSIENIESIEAVAKVLYLALWGLSFLALFLVILIYITLNKSVLKPIALLARALSAEASEKGHVKVTMGDSLEINQLISAFESMRNQVRDRQNALEHQALHDSLTGLPNRALLYDRLQNSLQTAQRKHSSTALLLLDLDRFKEINDTLGHQIGDRILQRVGMRLSESIRESDTVARLGGDEFAIVAPGVTSEQARMLSNKVINSLDQVFNLDGHNLYISASVGIAMYPEQGNDATTLVRHADIAMYHAKRTNRNVSIYDAKQDDYNINQLALVGDIRKAINDDQLDLHYQPKVDILTGRPIGVEALLRWEHPTQGYIPPEVMIRVAEQTGLITSLTKWVITRALQQYEQWRQFESNLTLSINLSTWDLQNSQLLDDIFYSLEKYSVSPQSLILEITESAVMTDPANAREVLEKFSKRGIGLSIDDFGTGFSSLGYLKLLPVSELKIDKSFVMEMLTDENDSIIVRSTIDLAHNLGLKVVAEGIECREIIDHLRLLGCDIGQGYYISKPLPINQLIHWLQKKRPNNITLLKQ